jgi:hypothetical protein
MNPDEFWISIEDNRVHIYNSFHKRKLGYAHNIYSRKAINAEYMFAVRNDIRYQKIMLIWWRSLTAAQRADIMQAYSDLIAQGANPAAGNFWHSFLDRFS